MNLRVSCSLFVSLAVLSQTSPSLGQAQGQSTPIILGPVMVTGELIDRPLNETGTSAEVFDEATLEERPGLDSVRDALEQTPNVTVLTGTIQAPTIRGVDGTGAAIGGNAFLAGTRPRLNWQIDGRPASYNEVIFGDLATWDLERIEVLRGPQSSLVGRNSIAGTVIIETNDPIFTPELAAQVAGGNFEQRRLSAMVNAPVFDDLVAVRLSVDRHSYQSHVTYMPFPGVADPGEAEAFNFRGKVLITPDIGTDTKLLLSATRNKTVGPNAEIVVRPFENHVSDFPFNPVHTNTANSVGAELSTSLSGSFRFELNSTFTEYRFDRVATPQGGPANIDTRELVVEPKLVYEDDDGYSAVAGIYYYRARQDEYLLFAVTNDFADRTDTLAAYAEGIVPLTDQLDLLLGARYEREERKREGGDAGAFVDFFLDETYQGFLPKAGLNWRATPTTTFGVQVARGFNAGGAGVTFPFPNPFPVIPYTFESEYVWNYEVYGRQEFAGGRVRTTQNVFYADYRDMQLPVDVTPANPGDGAVVIQNFDDVRTYGAELSVSVAVTDAISIYGGVGLLWTDIRDAPAANLEGNELQTAPNFTANAGVIWRRGNWRAGAAARYSSAYYTDLDNRPSFEVDPFFTADAEVAYDFGGVETFLSVKNIFDSDEPISLYPPTALTAPLDRAVLQRPRTLLIGAKARF